VPAIQSGGTEDAATDEMDIAILQDHLAAELERLGKDPSSTVSSAPSGADNMVFDLAAEIVDPDGEGGDPPTGIELTWTEQLAGDYDQNGLVNASDLTPLGANWQAEVAYDDPSLHGGFAFWPSGNPDDGKTGSAAILAASPDSGRRGGSKTRPGDDIGNSPARASGPILDRPLRSVQALLGAENWRLARIDGNRDGQLYQYDITPIAVHWKQRLSHYRVYAKAPGETGFALVETVTPQRNSADPVRLDYELPVSEVGSYGAYVAPYDDASATEGPASPALYINVETGEINQAPVAKLSVTPSFAGAPADITLDATASYDTDGEITAYHWDFDGDGSVDWVSIDPAPEVSTGGTVQSITPGGNGLVTVSYNQGSVDWYFPSVVAEDDLGLTSLPAFAQLGISGWELEYISDEENPKLGIYHYSLDVDPGTGQLVAYGTNDDSDNAYIAWREGPEQWREELIVSAETHEYFEGSVEKRITMHLAWDNQGKPVAFLDFTRGYGISLTNFTFIGNRNGTANWEITPLYAASEDVKTNSIQDMHKTESGKFLVAVTERTTEAQYRFMFMEYSQDGVNILDPILEQPYGQDIYEYLEHVALGEGDTRYYTTYKYSVSEYKNLHDFSQIVLNRETDLVYWEQITLTPADLGIADYTYLQGMYRDPTGELLLHVRSQNVNSSPDYETTGWYAIRYPSLEKTELWTSSDPPAFVYDGTIQTVFSGDYGTCWVYHLDSDYAETVGLKSAVYFRRYEGGKTIAEDVYTVAASSETSGVSFRGLYVAPDGGQSLAVLSGANMPEVIDPQESGNKAFVLATRIDPRFD
jgi:hypothetical protein